jgi:hemerythrin-like domain-containing protein
MPSPVSGGALLYPAVTAIPELPRCGFHRTFPTPVHYHRRIEMINDRSDIVDPVRELIDEHVIFMSALEELVAVTHRLVKQEGVVDPEALAAMEAHWHAVDEHLNVHFLKEEEIFFPAIERLFPTARVKFQFLHVDHDRLRDAFEVFTKLLQHARYGHLGRANIGELAHVAAEMVRLFYYHIVAEDVVYLDVASEMLTAEESRALGVKMRALEDRLRERCGAVSLESREASTPTGREAR